MENRNFQSAASATPPSAPSSPSAGYPTNGSAGSGIPATQPGAYWFHKIGEELRAIITNSGITPSDSDLSQIAKSIQNTGLNTAISSGTANAIIASFSPVITLLKNGMTLIIRAGLANTAASVTFTPNSAVIPAKTIVKGNNLPLDVGDISGASHWVTLQYDQTLDKWVLENPANGVLGLGIGFGQTWQTFTTGTGNQRIEATNYYNTTGKPIAVAITGQSSSTPDTYSTTSLSINGINIQNSTATSRGSVIKSSVFGIVPPGSYYSVSVTPGSLSLWAELR
ncbi:MAG: hypothetical protein NTY69_02020 [Methylococcales bacterium]|nr:hypothetical protein [Methylococcales bacterium]